MAKGSLVLLGSGPGIGVATASLFASKGFGNIALLARNAERLKSDAATVAKANPTARIKVYAVDIGDHAKLKSTLEQVEQDVGPPEFVLFNAARIAMVEIGKEPPENLIGDFKIMSIGLYVAVSWAMPHLVELAKNQDARPSLFLSGSSIWRNGQPPVFSLSMQKAAQHNLLQSAQRTYGPQGVHVADVTIEGAVNDDEPVLNAKNVAKTHWDLYQESPEHWRFEAAVGELPPFEPARKD